MRSGFDGWAPIAIAAVLLVGALVVAPTGSGVSNSGSAPPAPPATSPVPNSPMSVPIPAGPIEVAPAYRPGAGVSSESPVPSQTVLDVAVGLPSRDASGLAAFVAASTVPGTPAYHSFLRPTLAATRFGAAPGSVAAARGYFEQFGLRTTVDPNGLLLYVSGPAAGMAEAFDTTFDEYRSSSGTTFISHPTVATLPGSLGTNGVFGLGNVTPLTPEVGAVPGVGPSPEVACTGISGALAPCEIANAYDIAPLEANGTNGTGVRLAVVDAYAGNENQSQLSSDLATFVGDAALSEGMVNYLYPVPTVGDLNSSGTNSGWNFEDALDLEWARASAPGATIDMTFSPNAEAGLYDAIDWLVSEDAANVVSMSWGEPDTGVYNAFDTPCSTACNASTDGSYEILGPVLELGAAEGITFVAASGDCGAADGTSGDATNFPASDPYVTGVGGTVLGVTGVGVYSGEVAWSGNDSGATSPGCNNQGGSGGGFAPFPQPWWQSGISDPSGDRGVPDVAMDAGTPVAIVADGSAFGVEGTSVGTPIWAGIAAIADSYAASDLGLLNPSLYDLLRSPSYGSDFHDIVSGSNGYPAGTGWDPVTGIGSPIVGALVPALAHGGGLAGASLSTSVFASPRYGQFPLTVSFAVSATGGTGGFPLEGVSFGDGNSALTNGTIVRHTFADEGDYFAQSFVADGAGNTSTSLPVLIAVGGSPLTVTLTLSTSTPTVGEPVTLSASASGGLPPYSYSYYFGDGGFTPPTPAAATHTYGAAGEFCALVIAVDSATPIDAGVSARAPVIVGGGPGPNCADGTAPFTVSPNGTPPILDAPADYGALSLFNVTGGANAPGGLAPSTSLTSNDSYLVGCGCAILRYPGNYSVTEWANDTVDASANATVDLTVAPPLIATFATSTVYGPAPLKVYFFSSAHGGNGANANLTQWTFGDGASAVGHSVNTTYTTPGEYFALGQLSDRGHGNGSEAFLIDVEPVLASPPVGVGATISPATNLTSGTLVRFTGTAVGPPAQIASADILWDLGDGHSAFGADVAETFDGPLAPSANNTVVGEITVETAYLQTIFSIGFHLVPFFAVEAGGYTPRSDALVGAAAVTPGQDLVPFDIFGNVTASGPRPITLSWNLGDGSSALGPEVQHTFYAAEGYTVTTLVTNSWGDSVDLLNAVAANGPLGIAGGPSPGVGPKPLTVTISTAAYGGKGPPYHYAWTLVNGTHSSSSTVTLFFPNIGTYSVHLNVTDRAGDRDERNFTIVVDYPWPLAPLEIVAIGMAVGLLVAVIVTLGLGPRNRRPGADAWLDHPRTASDGTPVW